MLLSLLRYLLLFSIAVSCAVKAEPIVYTFGDSTMAECRTSYLAAISSGWVTPMTAYFQIQVKNMARSGYSARQAAREGIYDEALKEAKKGDFVIIQWGRNDRQKSQARNDCLSTDQNGCKGISSAERIVLTFEQYLVQMAKQFKAKGVEVIIASMATQNLWQSGTFVPEVDSYVDDAKRAAMETGSTFVDMHASMTAVYRNLNANQVGRFYVGHIPGHYDITHFTEIGALIAARRFLITLSTTNSGLKRHILQYHKIFSHPKCSA